jgi:hypothetical protein
MTEWMFQDVYDVEEWYVCSSPSHQARCDVALDMGHSRPAGHKWAQGSPHKDKWACTGCYAGAVPAGRAGRWKPGNRSGSPRHFGVAGRRILHPLRGAPRGTRYRTLSASHRD